MKYIKFNILFLLFINNSCSIDIFSYARELHFGDYTRAIFLNIRTKKDAKERKCYELKIGYGDFPFHKSKQNIKIHFKNNKILDLSSNNIIKDVKKIYPNIYGIDASGGSEIIRNPSGLSYHKNEKGTLYFSEYRVMKAYVLDEKLIAITIYSQDKKNVLKSIEVNGKSRNFPLRVDDLVYLFGKPNKDFEYISK